MKVSSVRMVQPVRLLEGGQGKLVQKSPMFGQDPVQGSSHCPLGPLLAESCQVHDEDV